MKNLLYLFCGLCVSVYAQTTFTYSGTGKWDVVANWSPSYPGTNIKFGDQVVIDKNSNVEINVMIYNYGTFINKGVATAKTYFSNNGFFINDSSFTSHSFFVNNSSFVNNNLFNSSSFFTNNSSLVNYKSFVSQSFFENNGDFTDAGTFESYSYFNGINKSHKNDCTIGGIFSAGKQSDQIVGKYVFDNNITMSAGLTFSYDIKSVTSFDTFLVKGNAIVNGIFSAKIPTGFDPQIGASFTILTASSVTGKFSYLSLPTLPNDKKFEVVYTNTSVLLKVVSVTAIDDQNGFNSSLNIFPTSVQDALNISVKNSGEIVEIYNTSGVLMKQIEMKNNTEAVNVSFLNSGTYIVRNGNDIKYFVKY
ncbi:MAG: T9SS type A sorting domain-containing protein [Cytophagales bacterium]